MLFHSASNQLLSKHPLVTLGEVLCSLGSMAEVLHDAIDTRLKVGKLEEVMDLWEWDAEKIDGTCDKLLGDLHVIRKQLGGKSEALDEYEAPHDHSEPDPQECRTTERSYHNLSLVRNAAHDMADHIRSVWHIPTNWGADQGPNCSEKPLEFVLVTLEWARRDILKQLAELLMIFDEYDDSDSAQPWEAWLSPHVPLRADINAE